MSQQINVNILMDKDIKEQADNLFNELGFNLTTAINAFVKQAIRERAIPFKIKTDNDPYFTDTNMKYINQSLDDLKNGRVVIKTMAELEEMESE